MKTVSSRMRHFFNLVAESSEILVIPGKNEDEAIVMMSLTEYNALTETSHLLSTEENRKVLLEPMRQAESGDVMRYDLETASK